MSKRTNSPTQSLEDEFYEKSQNSRMGVDALLLLRRQWYQKHRAWGLSVGVCRQRLDDQTGLSAWWLQNLVSDGPAGPRAKLTDQDRRIILERLQGTETAHTPGVVMVRQFRAVKLERLSLDAAMALDIRYRAILATNAVFLLGREQKYSIDPSPHMTGAVSEIVNALTIHPQRERQPSLGIIEPRTDDLPAGQTAVPRNGHGSAAGLSEGGVGIGEPKPSRELNADQLGSITSGERDTKTVSGRKSRRALVKLKRQATATKLSVKIAPSRRVSFGSQIESALTEELSNLPNHQSDQISLCRRPYIWYPISTVGTTTSTANAGRVEAETTISRGE